MWHQKLLLSEGCVPFEIDLTAVFSLCENSTTQISSLKDGFSEAGGLKQVNEVLYQIFELVVTSDIKYTNWHTK